MEKIRVAFIYHESNVVLSGNHYDNTYYHFFMKALNRNEQIKVTYFATKDTFDSLVLKDKFDIIIDSTGVSDNGHGWRKLISRIKINL